MDPISIPLFVALAFGFALFPVGLLLPGCACCGNPCPEAVEFDRCIKLRSLSPQAPPSIHGFSAVAKQLEDINAFKACRQQNPDGTCAEWGYNLQFRVPRLGFTNFVAREVETDFDTVLRFLKGQQTLTCTFTNLFAAGDSQWEISVHQPTPYCGHSLCSRAFLPDATGGVGYENYGMQLTGVIPLTATVQYPPGPNPYVVFSSDGVSSTPNLCAGLDTPPALQMRLRTATQLPGSPDIVGNCAYEHSYSTCEWAGAAVTNDPSGGYSFGPSTYQMSIPLSQFFCGDLLWAIENGPCRGSVHVPQLANRLENGDDATASVTLGGGDNEPWRKNVCFASTALKQTPYNANKCAPLEVEFEVANDVPLVSMIGGSTPCSVEPGTYVARGGFQSCNWILYTATEKMKGAYQIFNEVSGQVTSVPCPTAGLYANMIRGKWCDPFIGGDGPYGTPPVYPPPTPRPPTAVYRGSLPVGRVVPGELVYGIGNDLYLPKPGQVVGSIKDFSPFSPGEFTATPAHSTVPVSGGVASVTFCCPETQKTLTVPPTTNRYARTWLIEGAGDSAGKTAYVTQPGYQECRFTLRALNPPNAFDSVSRILWWRSSAFNDPCFYFQVEALEGTPCPWTVSVAGFDGQPVEWVQATKVESGPDAGLLKIVVEDYPFFAVRRFAYVTVTAGGTTFTFTIQQGLL